ncbi:MAG: thiamine-phosphate synthase family protein [candidate division WOR-3 bacterium]
MTAVEKLERAVKVLEACREFAGLVPEVRVNFVYAPEGVRDAAGVLGVDGRITVVAGLPKAAGPVRPGVSDHMARLLMEAQKYDATVRAGLNFRWNERIMAFVERYCRERGLGLGSIDRTAEPRELIGREQGSMAWKVARLVESSGGRVPPVFYESRGWGKEPLFVLVGEEPEPVAGRAIDIARGFAR